MELKDLILMGKPWEYNFEWECKALQPFETFERYFRYKASAKGHKVSFPREDRTYCEAEDFIEQCQTKYKSADCDNCGPVSEIYSALWSDCNWRGDTMNSVQTSMAELVHFCFEENKKAKLKGRHYNSTKYLIQCFCGENCKNFKEQLYNTKGLHDYVDAYHTLGNFVLVPAGFNVQRGTSLRYKGIKIDDYWDLSLKYLKDNGYDDFKPDDFKKYINYFFLWDYVEPDNSGGYKVDPVGMKEWNDKRDLPEFLEKTVMLIERRGRFMTAMLIIQNEDKSIYSDIRKGLQDQALNGINGAAEYIVDKFDELNNSKFVRAKDILDKLKNEVIE